METTIIKLGGEPTGGSNLVVQSATFEEAFGDYSNAGGSERKANRQFARQGRKAVNTENNRRSRKSRRQEARQERKATISRRARKANRQEARQERKATRLDNRQERRLLKLNLKSQGEQELDDSTNYNEVPESNQVPSGNENYQDQGYAPEQDGGYDEPQGGGGYDERPAPAPSYGGGNDYASQEESNYEENVAPEEGAYGDDNSYEGEYIQEEDEFGDDSYFNVEGMDGKAVVSPYVKDTVQKIKNNTSAYKTLAQKRQFAEKNGDHTRGLDNIMSKTRARIIELKSTLDGYCNADGNPTEMKRRRREVNLALGRRLKPRNLRNQYAGSETPVESDLNPQFGENRIEIPAKSGFDAYSEDGRPVIINGVEDTNVPSYGNDIYGDFEPTTIEMSSSFDGGSSNKKVLLSVAVGIGVGALALYFAKKKGWI